MKGILCCFGKASASNVVQETAQPSEPPQQPQPSEPPQPVQQLPQATDSSVRVADENAEVNDEVPFGDNAFLNTAWRNRLPILHEDHEFPDSSADVYPSYPPLPANSGVPFAWRQIVNGTQNFRKTNFLGRGNFGAVYRCDFPRLINKVGAAKIQKPSNETGPLEFIAEVTTLRAANHPNVVKLLGTCYTRKNRAIVYEFMPKGSLDQYLFANARQSQVLDWNTRIRIAVGVAEGLKYLHIGLKTIHGDIKAGNILLDENFVPKLTDFGIAVKVVENENGVEQQSVITPIKGTRGFIAPETEQLGLTSTMSDVYSFGVFLLVLVTGRKAYDERRPPETRKITDWLMPVLSGARSTSLVVDPVLGNKYSVEGINRLFFGAEMCINAQVDQRPDMYVMEMIVRQVAAFPVQEVPARHSF